MYFEISKNILQLGTPYYAWASLKSVDAPKKSLTNDILRKYWSRSSERIVILVFLWCKATNFQGIGGDCRLGAPTNFIRGIPAGKLDSFRFDFVSTSDERGSVINDYL